MRFFVVLLGMFVCGVANAATMCVPDLSTCTSCTNFSYSGMTWSANCCGVDVSGIALEDVGANSVSIAFNEVSLPSPNGYYLFRQTCFVLHPFVMPYGYVVGCSAGAYMDASLCGAIVPKCMVEKCPEKVVCDSPYA